MEKQYQPHQQRVVDEKAENDGRLEKLKAFIESNPTFETLPGAEQVRLCRQARIMRELSDVLGERIAEF